jgi:hypothetical protein
VVVVVDSVVGLAGVHTFVVVDEDAVAVVAGQMHQVMAQPHNAKMMEHTRGTL